MKILQKARCLRELAEECGLHGLYFQHVALCRRRAWLHLMGATHAVHHSRVRRGACASPDGEAPWRSASWARHCAGRDRLQTPRGHREKGNGRSTRRGFPAGTVLRRVHDRRFRRAVACRGARLRITREDQLPPSPDEDVLDQLVRDAWDSRDLMAEPAPPARRIPLCDACSCNLLCWDEEQDGHGDCPA